jgi:ribosomal protein S18 acetylase RimI-like enzyme
MSVSTQQVVSGDLLEDAWKLYQQSFDELRHLAVQRHVMYAEEFDAVMADARVDKYLIFNDERNLMGVGTITNEFESMTLVSPDYFEHRWPDRYQAGHVFYIGFVAVHPDAHGSGIFGELVKAMTEMVAKVDGVAVLDVCNHNKDRLHLPRAIHWLASTWSAHVQTVHLDAQSYIGYDFARSA